MTEERNPGIEEIFHRPWLPPYVAGDQVHSLVPYTQPGQQGLVRPTAKAARTIRVPPSMAGHPFMERIAQYRWHTPELAREARRIIFSLLSSYGARWRRQVNMVARQLLELIDRDRVTALMDRGKEMAVTVEHVGRYPVVDTPFRVDYDGSEWLVYPLEDWNEIIPFEAHYNKAMLERAGIAFDTWHIADELPRPSLGERARESSWVAGLVVAGIVAAPVLAVVGFAAVLGSGLAALAALDPALVGTLVSRAEPEKADWFIIARWYH